MASKARQGNLGAEFFIDERGEECLRRADSSSAIAGRPSEEQSQAAMRAKEIRWAKSPLLVKELPENLRYTIELNLKEKLNEEEFLQLRPARRGT